MNEEPTTAGAENPEPQTTPPAAAPPAAKTVRKLPSWLPIAALAVVPALVVGLIVFFVAGGSDGSESSSKAVLDGFVRLSLGQGEEIESFNEELPPGFPADLPAYDGAAMGGSFAIKSADGTTYIIAYDTGASVDEVYDFYLDRLDQDPWQLELAREADDFTGMQFARPDNADIQGSVTISHSDLDGRTAIFVFILDTAQTSSGSSDTGGIVPTISRALPPNFPNDIPIYKGQASTVVTDTYFQRDAGQNVFLVSFITKDADVDIIDFYTKEFANRGWVVKDGVTEAGDFSLNIEFDDGKATTEVQGSIRADVYAIDGDYTEVNLIVQVSASRGRGN